MKNNPELEKTIAQMILAALEFRGFYDAGKYLDDDILEHVMPVVKEYSLSIIMQSVGKKEKFVGHYVPRDFLEGMTEGSNNRREQTIENAKKILGV